MDTNKHSHLLKNHQKHEKDTQRHEHKHFQFQKRYIQVLLEMAEKSIKPEFCHFDTATLIYYKTRYDERE